MAVKVMQGITRYIGTAAEIAAYDISKANIGSTFFESDTGILKIVNQAGVLVNAPSESVGLSGSNVIIGAASFTVSGGDTLRGKAADKPVASAAHAAIPYCFYFSIDTGVLEATDGANWVVM
jgi:hypothetical protein